MDIAKHSGHLRDKTWMQYVLGAAAIYNAVWGAFAIFLPSYAFRLAGMAQPNYPELWQCIGMIVGMYGIGYGIAATNPVRHWPIVLVGLLGKILGPVGFANAAMNGRLPWSLGWTIVTNDLIWLIPFTLILMHVSLASRDPRRVASPEIQRMALRARTQYGMSLLELSEQDPILLVFLRHTGCMFCREALAEISAKRKEIEATGTKLVLVHMGADERAAKFLARYELHALPRVSDPNKVLYRAFGLGHTTLWGLFGPPMWWRAFEASVVKGQWVGPIVDDVFQMPGVFLVFHGEVLRGFHHQTPADQPDYVELTSLGSVPV